MPNGAEVPREARRRADGPDSAAIQADRAQGKRGRKPASESRAAEIRTKLLVWKQTPEFQRISLRALASEIGTSHQLLNFYLKRWDKWQAKEYRRKSNAIRARAEGENRDVTQQEQAQVVAYDRAAFSSMLDAALKDALPRWLREFREEARRGKLSKKRKNLLNSFGEFEYHRYSEFI
jgi:hypothetical protein